MIRLNYIHLYNPTSLNDSELPEAFPIAYGWGTHFSPCHKKSQPKAITLFHTIKEKRRFQLARSIACLNLTFKDASDPTNPCSMWNQNQNEPLPWHLFPRKLRALFDLTYPIAYTREERDSSSFRGLSPDIQ
jgi:hypothetical protein